MSAVTWAATPQLLRLRTGRAPDRVNCGTPTAVLARGADVFTRIMRDIGADIDDKSVELDDIGKGRTNRIQSCLYVLKGNLHLLARIIGSILPDLSMLS
jgi:hypothetical protein